MRFLLPTPKEGRRKVAGFKDHSGLFLPSGWREQGHCLAPLMACVASPEHLVSHFMAQGAGLDGEHLGLRQDIKS